MDRVRKSPSEGVDSWQEVGPGTYPSEVAAQEPSFAEQLDVPSSVACLEGASGPSSWAADLPWASSLAAIHLVASS